jgi:predicted LPLAT superfamily acyltransferase
LQPEAGSLAGLKFLAGVASLLGRRTLHAVLYPVTAYFYFTRKVERAASRKFLAKVLDRPVRRLDVYRHLLSFAKVSADRFFLITGKGKPIPVRFIGEDTIQKALAKGRSGIFLAAHMGSFEAARVVGSRIGGIKLRIVLDRHVNRRFMEIMESLNPDLANTIIDSEQGPINLGLNIANTLKAGEWVGFLADRHRPGDRTTTAFFLDEQAHFPTGAYLIASAFNAPVVCLFCHCIGRGYEVHCELLTDRMQIARNERSAALTDYVTRYAAMLERHARAAPTSWFNFFDFWAE